MGRKDYSKLAATATRLIDKFGRDLVFYENQAIHDPVTSTDTATSPLQHNTIGAVIDASESLIDGTRIGEGNKVVLLIPAIAPSKGWKLDLDAPSDAGSTIGTFPGVVPTGGLAGLWAIAVVRELKPAGTVLLYEVELSK